MPIPNSIKQPMMEAILGFKELIQFSGNLMNHIMQIVFVPPSVISHHFRIRHLHVPILAA